MKDIVISGKRIKTELSILFWCYIAANLLNAYSIWFYETRWIELLTFQRLIIVIAMFFYALTWFFRGIWYIAKKIGKKG